MPFEVTTGGPIGGDPVNGPTFGDMITAIADDVDDTFHGPNIFES